MSMFKGLITEIEGISVDQFQGQNYNSQVYFLSHCHSDHTEGIGTNKFFNHLNQNGYKIFTSKESLVILKNQYPRLGSHVVALNIEGTHEITIPKSINGDEKVISVSLIPAGHCPGSVMFLFTTVDKTTILYTGDFRLDPEDLPNIKQLRNGEKTLPIDKLYFDSTFWNTEYPYFPSRERSCDIASNLINEWISKGESYVVNINRPAYYGSELLFKYVADKLKMPIHIQDDVLKSYSEMPEMEGVFTGSPTKTKIHSCTLTQHSKQPSTCCTGPHVRQIRPTAWKWNNMKEEDEIFSSEENERFNVCYSSHSSLKELKQFIKYLEPKAIEPCVLPNKGKECKEVEDFYKSINSFCKDFLEVPCRMPNSEGDSNKLAAIQAENPHCGESSSPLKVEVVDSDSDKQSINSLQLLLKKQKI